MPGRQSRIEDHWSDDDLLNLAYGLDPRPDIEQGHFETCPDCRLKWLRMKARRAAVVSEPPISDSLMRSQRLAVEARVRRAPSLWIWRAAPVAAVALLLLVAIVLQRPSPQPQPLQTARQTTTQPSDAELLAEIAGIVSEEAPRAADPIRGLFSAEQQLEVQ